MMDYQIIPDYQMLLHTSCTTDQMSIPIWIISFTFSSRTWRLWVRTLQSWRTWWNGRHAIRRCLNGQV